MVIVYSSNFIKKLKLIRELKTLKEKKIVKQTRYNQIMAQIEEEKKKDYDLYYKRKQHTEEKETQRLYILHHKWKNALNKYKKYSKKSYKSNQECTSTLRHIFYKIKTYAELYNKIKRITFPKIYKQLQKHFNYLESKYLYLENTEELVNLRDTLIDIQLKINEKTAELHAICFEFKKIIK